MTDEAISANECLFFHFGLIVTGKGELAHLPKLFNSLMATGICYVEVIRYTGQRSPITSDKKKLKMVGSGKTIPDRDVTEIGLPTRRYLSSSPCHFVIIIDDLEHDRRDMAQQVYERYRSILDDILTEEQQRRVSVHFLVNMLEAYYFADANAVNIVLNLNPPLVDFEGDVEVIIHPKGELKRLHNNFREIDDGGEILNIINIDKVLSRPETCAYLRTLFAWCVKILELYPYFEDLSLSNKYSLTDGVLSEITRVQIDYL
jgi:hypothetical protein